MKNQLCVLVAILLLSACAGIGKKENSLSIDNTKGNVERMVIKMYEAEKKFGEIYFEEGDAEMVFVRKYNKEGNLTEISGYDDEDMTEDDLDSKTVYKYDKKNNTNETYEYDWDGELLYKTKEVFDGKHMTQYIISEEDEDLANISYEYKGGKMSEVYDNLRGVVTAKYVYSQKEYDDYEFDEDDVSTLILMKGDNVVARKNLHSEETFEYKGDNVVGYHQVYDDYHAGFSVVYDKHNNITAINGAAVIPSFLAIPSSFMQILNRDITLDEGEYEFEITYEYDRKGNWTKATCFATYEDEYLVITRDIDYR